MFWIPTDVSEESIFSQGSCGDVGDVQISTDWGCSLLGIGSMQSGGDATRIISLSPIRLRLDGYGI